jgi:hypothetical protein
MGKTLFLIARRPLVSVPWLPAGVWTVVTVTVGGCIVPSDGVKSHEHQSKEKEREGKNQMGEVW